MKYLFPLLLSCLATACGGGGGGGDAPVPPAAAPTIRFTGSHEPGCEACSVPRDGTLTLAPVSGAATLGSRDIARVEVSVNGAAPQVLAAPNGRNAAGQATFVFPVAAANFGTPPVFAPRNCGRQPNYAITVTDSGGFAFTKYFSTCRTEVFGAFSDYGDKTFTVRSVPSPTATIDFYRPGAGGYVDNMTGMATSGTPSWTVNARQGDELRANGQAGGGETGAGNLTLSVSDNAGAIATSEVSLGGSTGGYAESYLACCGPGTPSTAQGLTAQFFVSAEGAFSVYYRVFNPAANTVVTEFRGGGSGNTFWRVPVQPGHELTLEASPQTGQPYVRAYVERMLDVPANGNTGATLGTAWSSRAGVPARVSVLCCAR